MMKSISFLLAIHTLLASPLVTDLITSYSNWMSGGNPVSIITCTEDYINCTTGCYTIYSFVTQSTTFSISFDFIAYNISNTFTFYTYFQTDCCYLAASDFTITGLQPEDLCTNSVQGIRMSQTTPFQWTNGTSNIEFGIFTNQKGLLGIRNLAISDTSNSIGAYKYVVAAVLGGLGFILACDFFILWMRKKKQTYLALAIEKNNQEKNPEARTHEFELNVNQNRRKSVVAINESDFNAPNSIENYNEESQVVSNISEQDF